MDLIFTSYNGTNKEKIKKSIKKNMLTQGFFEAVVPFPALDGHIPSMTAYLKNVEFVLLDDIGDDKEYIRVSSIDSPFREMLSWAYMSTACRPGLPDRDFEFWTQEMMDNYVSGSN